MPDPVELETSFGAYQAGIEPPTDGPLAYYRRMEIYGVHLPAEAYDAFRTFLQQRAPADRARIVLVAE